MIHHSYQVHSQFGGKFKFISFQNYKFANNFVTFQRTGLRLVYMSWIFPGFGFIRDYVGLFRYTLLKAKYCPDFCYVDICFTEVKLHGGCE